MYTKVLYHANCNDGAGAALAAYLHLSFSETEYIPVQYDQSPPEVAGCVIYIVDFSYPRPVLIEMAKRAKSLIIIDHHKTAEQCLTKPFPPSQDNDPLCPIETVFDNKMSGAVLTWKYFSQKPIPLLLRLIQDRDLWQFKLGDTKAVSKGLSLYPDWKLWKKYIDDPENIKELIPQGQAIISFLQLEAEKITQTPPRYWSFMGDIIPIYNIPGFLISDTLHLALEKYPECHYAVAYFDLPTSRVYSLRSRQGSDHDVGALAASKGGGGHKHAAGFSVPLQ